MNSTAGTGGRMKVVPTTAYGEGTEASLSSLFDNAGGAKFLAQLEEHACKAFAFRRELGVLRRESQAVVPLEKVGESQAVVPLEKVGTYVIMFCCSCSNLGADQQKKRLENPSAF
jgi:hypothetical protein